MAQYVCMQCGFSGRPLRLARGSLFLEVLLWLTFIVPGVFYTLWRLESKTCPRCRHQMERTDSIWHERPA